MLAKFGVDTAENGLLTVCQKLANSSKKRQKGKIRRTKMKRRGMTASVAKENLKAVVKKFTRRACFVCDQVKRFVFIVLGRGDIGLEKRRDDEPQHATFHVPDHLHLEDLEGIILCLF